MKKNRLANILMVVLIAVIAVCGILLAMHMLPEKEEEILGTQFAVTPIPENALVTNEGTENLCTITIRCDTILDNLDLLESAKEPYVPMDGVILVETTVEFSEDETVFEVLQRVCEAADIQLEYSWTPLYNSYYIEGISHLYEFDCGHESGWMYEVNGEYPNSGCSSYKLKPGDAISWRYTCVGLGADVGGNVHEP